MPSLRESPFLTPNPRRHVRNHSAPSKQTASSSSPVSTWPTPSPSTLPLPVPTAEPSFSQSTSFAPHPPLMPPSRANMTATKILTTVRKSFSSSSSKKRQTDSPRSNEATLEHSHDEHHSRLAFTPSQCRFQDVASTRPSIEQIAMGLHISRTPHLRQVNKRPLPPLASDGSHDSLPPHVHAPPPTRPSLKKSSTLTSSSSTTPASNSVLSKISPSTTTITSVTPSIAKSSAPIVSLRTRMMSRFLAGARSLAPLSDPESESPSAAEIGQPQARRKAVRFTSSTVVLEERASQH